MSKINRHRPVPRRTFLRTAGAIAGGAVLAACSPAADTGVVNFLWTDSNNARQPLLADFTAATGIKVNQTQVQYNELLDKINTVVQGGGDVDVIEMDTIWTAQFASAGWIEDLTSRVTAAVDQRYSRIGPERRALPGQAVRHAVVQQRQASVLQLEVAHGGRYDQPAHHAGRVCGTGQGHHPARPVGQPLVVEAVGRPDLRLGGDHVHPDGRAVHRRQRPGGVRQAGRHRGRPVDGRPALHAQGGRPSLAGVRRNSGAARAGGWKSGPDLQLGRHAA